MFFQIIEIPFARRCWWEEGLFSSKLISIVFVCSSTWAHRYSLSLSLSHIFNHAKLISTVKCDENVVFFLGGPTLLMAVIKSRSSKSAVQSYSYSIWIIMLLFSNSLLYRYRLDMILRSFPLNIFTITHGQPQLHQRKLMKSQTNKQKQRKIKASIV